MFFLYSVVTQTERSYICRERHSTLNFFATNWAMLVQKNTQPSKKLLQ